jgi:hypothetical protein
MLLGGIFGIRPQAKQQAKQNEQNKQNTSSQSNKIITSNEGEYIEYVEIKD